MRQTSAILERLKRGDTITPLDAMNDPEIRCMRLSERIREIEAMGYAVHHETVVTPTNKRVMSYTMIQTDADGQLRMAV